MTEQQLNIIARHFLIAAIWAEAPEGLEVQWTASAAATTRARAFVEAFCVRYPVTVRLMLARPGYGAHPDAGSPEAALGHDLYLTCAGHGAGFGDRQELGTLGALMHSTLRQNWRTWHIDTLFVDGEMDLYWNDEHAKRELSVIGQIDQVARTMLSQL